MIPSINRPSILNRTIKTSSKANLENADKEYESEQKRLAAISLRLNEADDRLIGVWSETLSLSSSQESKARRKHQTQIQDDNIKAALQKHQQQQADIARNTQQEKADNHNNNTTNDNKEISTTTATTIARPPFALDIEDPTLITTTDDLPSLPTASTFHHHHTTITDKDTVSELLHTYMTEPPPPYYEALPSEVPPSSSRCTWNRDNGMAVKDLLNMKLNNGRIEMMDGGLKQEVEEKKKKRFPWTWDDADDV